MSTQVTGLAHSMDLSDAPGGDMNFDEIFGTQSETPTTVEATPNNPAPAAAATTSQEPFIKAKTGTVYQTREDAVTGIERKDALIAELREQLKNQTGVDPVNKRQPQGPVNYTENQDQYFDDISSAVQKGDRKGYMEAQKKLIWDSLGPLAPTITALTRAHAADVVSQEIPDFRGFLSSDQFQDVAREAPLLAEAIKSAEANPAAGPQLPELYKVAYLMSQGRRVPELVRNVRTDSPVIPPRPTVHSTQTAPPTPGQIQAPPSLNTSAGRKTIIEQMEGRGIQDMKW